MIYRIVDCGGTLVKEPLAGNPELEFDTCIDPASTNAVMNCGIAEALDEKFSKPNDPLNPWPDHTLLQYDATCNELIPISCQPSVNGQALIANIAAQTTTVYSTDGTTFYDADFTVTTEPTGTAGTPTVVGDFYKYLATWYKKDGADYYEVASFTDAGTLITDASLITELDGHTFLTYSSVVYTGAEETSYGWGNAAGGNGVAFCGLRCDYEIAKLIPEGQDGYIAPGSLVVITDEGNTLTGVTCTDRSVVDLPEFDINEAISCSVAASVSCVEENLSYSTTEHLTGGTWINGCPIYRKTISIGPLPNTTIKSVPTGLTNAHLVSACGVATHCNGTDRAIPWTLCSVSYQLDVGYTSGLSCITVQAWNDLSSYPTAYMTLEYYCC